MCQRTFPCDKCGACCRHLTLFGKAYEWLVDGSTGMCRYFDAATNFCTIYPIRPPICNIEVGYYLYFSHISHDEFISQNQMACKILKNLSSSLDNTDGIS